MSEVPAVQRSRYLVRPDDSAVLIEARSTAGRINFGTQAVEGYLEAAHYDGVLVLDPAPVAELEVDLRTLRSGNALYDSELAQRLNVRRYPRAEVRLGRAERVGDRFAVRGPVTLHGQTREITGSISVEPSAGGWLVSGEHVFDIRDFEISLPSVLMLRIFPDVRIFLTLSLYPAVDGRSLRMNKES